jgi:hypothetical protein
MEELEKTNTDSQLDIPAIIRSAVDEFVRTEQRKAEPAYKVELLEERKRRELLERRVNELAEENRKTKAAADETERCSAIRAELQRMGISKIDLAFRAVKDDITRGDDGRLTARSENGEVGLKEFLNQFVAENPELLPARIAGGSGIGSAPKAAPGGSGISLEQIRPGMDSEELKRVRDEISRVAAQTLRGR